MKKGPLQICADCYNSIHLLVDRGQISHAHKLLAQRKSLSENPS